MSAQTTNGLPPLEIEAGEIINADAGLTTAAHRIEDLEVVVKKSRSTLSPEEKAIRARKRKLWRVFLAAVQRDHSSDPLVLIGCQDQFEKAWKRGGEKHLGDRHGDPIRNVENYALRVARSEGAKAYWARMTEEERAKVRLSQREQRRLLKEFNRKRKAHAKSLFLALGTGKLKLRDLDISARYDLKYAIDKAPLKKTNWPVLEEEDARSNESGIPASLGQEPIQIKSGKRTDAE